jgi:acetyl-CoA acetyltransferase
MARPNLTPVAIVGAAECDLGQVSPNVSPWDLCGQATARVLDDAGLQLSDIDGVFMSSGQARLPPQNICEYLRLRPAIYDSTGVGGASAMTQLAHAQAAIHSGICDVALIVFGSTQRSATRAVAAPTEDFPYETAYRPLLPVGGYAMAAQRHMALYGTKPEHLAQIAVSTREWAIRNPVAWEKEPLTIDDVLSARRVSTPFGVRDCCLVNDGGGAIIVTSAERAKDMKKPPIHVLGHAEEMCHRNISQMDDLTVSGAVHSGRRAYETAGVTPQDIDVAELYDCFSFVPLLLLEDLGFCKKGEGGPFVEGGRIGPGGSFPVNTAGGGLSYCHPGQYGILLLIEAARQLWGESGERQVKDCEVAMVHSNGGVLSTQCTAILGRTPTS